MPVPTLGFVITQGPILSSIRSRKRQNADVITRPRRVLDVCKLINRS